MSNCAFNYPYYISNLHFGCIFKRIASRFSKFLYSLLGDDKMGSSRSGRLSDYSGAHKTDGTGGTSGIDRCRQAFSCKLEEVAQCDFFMQNSAVPGTDVELSLIHERRIFAVTLDGAKVGALPTELNYLAGCLKDGNTYVGIVTGSGLRPLPYVSADFTAE